MSKNNTSSSTATTYVAAAKSTPKQTFPKKEQAIIFHSAENLKLFDYVKSIGDIIGPKNILFASRISNNRICIYLNKIEIVDQLVKNNPIIRVCDLDLPIRRLVTPAKRIVISNVCPSIPHELIETALKDFELQLVSPITFLRAGIPDDEYSHILSFRRQVYITPPNDDYQLQTSLVIPFENNAHRIFLSTDRMECFLCKETGHIATNCPNSQIASPLQPQVSTPSSPQPNATVETPSPTTPGQKRPPSSLNDSTESHLENDPPSNSNIMPPPKQVLQDKPKKPAKKKARTDSADSSKITENSQQIIKHLYTKTPQAFSTPVENLLAFLENTYGCNNPFVEAQQITNDVKSLLSDMFIIYPSLTERSLKNRFTRLMKKLKNDLQLESEEMDSITSQSSLDPGDDDYNSDSSQMSQKSSY